MKKIITTLVIATVALTSTTYAQYVNDALRFSQSNYGSTARFKGIGGAQIALGGDLSAIGGNPAGLGMFTKSEFSFTPEFNHSAVDANYLGQNNKTNKGQLNFNQIGAAFFSPTYRKKGQSTSTGLVSMVFGLGYNRNNDYSMESNFGGANTVSSMADYFAENSGDTSPNNLVSGSAERLAYDNYLISFDDAGKYYFPETFASASTPNQQFKNELRTGSVSEFNFSGAANVGNQIYIGASVGLVNLRYNSDAQYSESGTAREYINDNLSGNNMNYKFLFNQNQVTKGSGINGRIGVIIKAVEGLRLGATLQTPTWFVIDDSYTEQLDNRQTLRGTSGSKIYDFTYNLRTPLKGSLGGSYVIANQALISADVDFIDYASMRLSTSSNNDDVALVNSNNTQIRQRFRSAVNYRIGLEYKIDALSLRGGYGINGSPYKANKDLDTEYYTVGLGYRTQQFSIDFAFQRLENNGSVSPYTLSNGVEPVATLANTKTNAFLTLGFKF